MAVLLFAMEGLRRSKMKNRDRNAKVFWIALLLTIFASSIWIQFSGGDLVVSNLNWTDRKSNASVSFQIENKSDKDKTILVTAIAERHTEGRDGIALFEVGRSSWTTEIKNQKTSSFKKSIPLATGYKGSLTVSIVTNILTI